jgi:hypothetical protein
VSRRRSGCETRCLDNDVAVRDSFRLAKAEDDLARRDALLDELRALDRAAKLRGRLVALYALLITASLAARTGLGSGGGRARNTRPIAVAGRARSRASA